MRLLQSMMTLRFVFIYCFQINLPCLTHYLFLFLQRNAPKSVKEQIKDIQGGISKLKYEMMTDKKFAPLIENGLFVSNLIDNLF